MAGFRLFDLNPEQQKAVLTTEGPLLILAGAGTGKTRVITARVAHLIAEGVDPGSILAVTFTNKAANEMRERLAAMVEKSKAKKVLMSTFHALCVRILRTGIERLGYKRNFSIYDEGDTTGLIKKIITRTAAQDEKLDPGLAKSLISKAKNNGWREPSPGDEKSLAGAVFARYQQELKALNAVDFDDLLHQLGVRRSPRRSVYDTALGGAIAMLSGIFLPHGFNLSAPVFEGLAFPKVLAQEVERDLLHGLFGKTAVHPDQIAQIEKAYRVAAKDFEMATLMLEQSAPAVFRMHDTMCEAATHRHWARAILDRAAIYGIAGRPRPEAKLLAFREAPTPPMATPKTGAVLPTGRKPRVLKPRPPALASA